MTTIPFNPNDPIIRLSDNNEELQRAWGIVKEFDQAHGIADPGIAEMKGYRWEYMTTEWWEDHPNGGPWIHVFRHKTHPADWPDKTYLHIPADPSYCSVEDDLAIDGGAK